jgi:acyl carrier protein
MTDDAPSAISTRARAEIEAKVRVVLQRLKLIDGDVLVPLDSLAIVLVCVEIESLIGVDLAAESFDRASFASFDALVDVVAQNASRQPRG